MLIYYDLISCPGTPSTPTAFFGSHLRQAVHKFASVIRKSYGFSSCILGMRASHPFSVLFSGRVTKRSSRIPATLLLLRLSGGPPRVILALTTRYGLPQGSCSRVAQNTFHLYSLLRSIALLNFLLASLYSLTRPVQSFPADTALCAFLLSLNVVRLR